MSDNTAGQSLGKGDIYDKYFEEAEKNKSGNEGQRASSKMSHPGDETSSNCEITTTPGQRASSQISYPGDETRYNCEINATPGILRDDSREDAESLSKSYSEMSAVGRDDPNIDDLSPQVTDTHVDENGTVTECAQLACISPSSRNDNSESFNINPPNVDDNLEHRSSDYRDGYNFDYSNRSRPTTPDIEKCTDLVVANDETAIQPVPSSAIVETSTGVLVTAPNNSNTTTPPSKKTDRDVFIAEAPPSEEKKSSSGGKICLKIIVGGLLFLIVLVLGAVIDRFLLVPYGLSSDNNDEGADVPPTVDDNELSPTDDEAITSNEDDDEGDADRSVPLTTITPSSYPTISHTTLPTVYPSSSPTYIQLVEVGRPIYGTTSDALFGFSLSLSLKGARVGIGAPYRNEPTADLYRAGHAIAYERSHDGTDNVFDGAADPFDGTLNDAVDGFSGASSNLVGMSASQASEFWGEEEWYAMGDGQYGTKDNDWVGWVVPLSPEGDWYAVCGGFMSRPYVQVYEEDASAASAAEMATTGNVESDWIMRGNTIRGPGAGFGLSISLSKDGRRLAVGSRGYARVYQYVKASNLWVPLGGDIEESMVAIVSISGDGGSVAVGCYGDDTMYTNGGRVRVFELNMPENKLTQVGESYFGNGPEDGFGYAVSLSFYGRMVAVGTYSSNYVKVGKYDESSQTWIPMGDDIVGGELDNRFGSTLALSDSGRRLVIGSSKYNRDRGRAVVYRNMEDGTWNEIGEVIGDPDDREGYSVAISPDGEFVATGAPYGDNESLGVVNSGRVRVLKIMSFD